MELIKFIFSGFWVFLGFLILMNLIFDFLFKIWNRFWRHYSIRKQGYPPTHCDADGDFKETSSKQTTSC